MCRVWAMRSAGSIRCSVTRWSALAARGSGATEAVYVHAKIGIVDDRWLTLGSANLNEERGEPHHRRAALATATRYRLWAEHLELHAVVGDPAKLVDESWWPTASQQLARRQAGAPLTHRLVLLPGLSHRSRRLLGPIQSLLVDGKQPPPTGPGSTVQAGPTAALKRTSALTARKVSGSW